MKKFFTKQNIGTILFYTLFYLFIYFLITKNKYFFGSTLDYQTQHYLIPEYFRTLFYQTHDLFPDFAFHLGSGQNIYYFSYYGLFSPIIFLSYLFPHLSMLNYIIISSSIIVIFSACLFYFYLRKNDFSFIVSFLGGLMLLCASPFIFHAHRHIMFINYMPFLILGMFGVDRYFKNKKGGLLIISCFLMIMTSYYYSVGGLIALFIFGIYRYLEKNTFHFKLFLKDMLLFTIPFIISVFMAMFLLLPTAYTLLAGRGIKNSTTNLLRLFIPNFSFKYILYSTYSIGVTGIVIVACGYFAIKGKKQEKFLGILLLLFGLLPIFNYILNGTLYMDPKSLIPFLPFAIFITCGFFKKLFAKNIDFKFLFFMIIIFLLLGLCNILFIQFYIHSGISFAIAYVLDLLFLLLIFYCYYKFQKKGILVFYFIILLFSICINVNLGDTLMKKDNVFDNEVIKNILKQDDSFYRINSLYLGGAGLNRIVDSKHYSSTLYSSAFNRYYNEFYYDVFNNPVTYRNRSMTAFSTNILFHNFNGEKYIITDKNMNLGYDSYIENDDLKVYKNSDALPIGYATNKIINQEDYEKLNYPSTVINLLKSIVVPNYSSTVKPFELEKSNLSFSIISYENLSYEKTNKGYQIHSNKNGKMKIKIENDMNNNILFLRLKNNYDPSCSKGDLVMTINGIMNKLTCKSWKYHNENFIFDYILYNQDELNITFAPGFYDISDLEFYILDYDEIKNFNQQVDAFVIDREKTVGDVIAGSINVEEDGYFTIQIPYDKGFTIKVDGKPVTYENVNDGFLGFEIKKGAHYIEILYVAPYKKIGGIISVSGIILFGIYEIVQKRKKVEE